MHLRRREAGARDPSAVRATSSPANDERTLKNVFDPEQMIRMESDNVDAQCRPADRSFGLFRTSAMLTF
jgi:hypothetical protein